MGKTGNLVAIVGRPNVGKSTFFNRVIGQRRAILSDVAGTTRDYLYEDVEWNGVPFTLVDTAGLDFGSKSELEKNVLTQAKSAVAQANLILFMVDAKEGLTPLDLEVVRFLRKTGAKIFLTVNKVDTKKAEGHTAEFHRLGLGEPYEISSTTGVGIGDLLDELVKELPKKKVSKTVENVIRIAIVGRPNVGKSTLFNKMVGEERSVVSDISGTTRDAVNARVKIGDQIFEFIDTAGLRRRGRIEKGIEKFSALRVLRGIKEADVVLLLIDAEEGLVSQDMHIAELIMREHRAGIVIVNKWDNIQDKETGTVNHYQRLIHGTAPFLRIFPTLFISAKTGQRTNKIFEVIQSAYEQFNIRIEDEALDVLIKQVVNDFPPKHRNTKPKIYGLKQRSTAPPTFLLLVNNPSWFHFSYLRHVENKLREQYPMVGTPIKLIIMKK